MEKDAFLSVRLKILPVKADIRLFMSLLLRKGRRVNIRWKQSNHISGVEESTSIEDMITIITIYYGIAYEDRMIYEIKSFRFSENIIYNQQNVSNLRNSVCV